MSSSLKASVFFILLTVVTVRGQEIAPIPIEGQVGENVTITCRARFAGESINNVLQIVRPSGVVESYEEAPEVMGRLFRVTDVDDLTTYSLGPLMQSDNGTVLLCTVDSMNSNRSTIFVTSEVTSTDVVDVTSSTAVPIVDNTTSKGVALYGIHVLFGIVLMIFVSLIL